MRRKRAVELPNVRLICDLKQVPAASEGTSQERFLGVFRVVMGYLSLAGGGE